MIKRIISIIVILFIFPVLTKADENTDNSYEQISRAVIHLEHFEQIINPRTGNLERVRKPDGTAFFIARGKNLYIVSARHVVDKNYDLQARVRCKNNITNKMELIYLKLSKQRWIFHDDIGDDTTKYVDVAVQKISWIKDRSIKNFRFESKDSDTFEKNQLPYTDPLPPMATLSFGFFGNLGFELKEQRPFGRAGIVAMVTGKEFVKIDNKKFAEERTVLLDIALFSGNSGSPVLSNFNNFNTPLKLFGLIIATNVNYNYAVMEPVSRIIEVLELAKGQSNENLECWFLIE